MILSSESTGLVLLGLAAAAAYAVPAAAPSRIPPRGVRISQLQA